jgi:hypothetical protein
MGSSSTVSVELEIKEKAGMKGKENSPGSSRAYDAKIKLFVSWFEEFFLGSTKQLSLLILSILIGLSTFCYEMNSLYIHIL